MSLDTPGVGIEIAKAELRGIVGEKPEVAEVVSHFAQFRGIPLAIGRWPRDQMI